MKRWSVASKIWRWKSASSISQAYQASRSRFSAPLDCRRIANAGLATKSGAPGGISDSAAGTSSPSPSGPSSAVDDFERYVLGKTGGDEEEGEDADFHDIREQASSETSAAADEPEDDFLQELTKIEKGDSWGKKDRKDDLMMQRGYDDETAPFDSDVDPENDESLLDQDDAVFWSEELQKFVTPKGLLHLPGMGREDLSKPYQLRPDRLYFPGQTIEPEDFDMTRLPSSDPSEGPPRTKKAFRKNEVLAAADFRNVRFLSLFLSETSRILPRRLTAVSWKSQRKIAREIKTARALGLLPFSSMGDPPFRYLRNKPAKDIDPEDEFHEGDEEGGLSGGGRFRGRRMF